MAHVFISYVRENEADVRRLCDALTRHGVEVWLDKTQIAPGVRWQDAISEAINKGDFFLACFSIEYGNKDEAFMNEEITLAIERLRTFSRNRTWFIPILFSGEVPNWPIRAGETLRHLQWVELNDVNWDSGIQQILKVIQPTVNVIRLRSKPKYRLSEKSVNAMFSEQWFFDNFLNSEGKSDEKRYEAKDRDGEIVILDHVTGLIWQQFGSENKLELEEAQEYVGSLTQNTFAGYKDWRLPTLEEGMSLIEQQQLNREDRPADSSVEDLLDFEFDFDSIDIDSYRMRKSRLPIDARFDRQQESIWTSDRMSSSEFWTIDLAHGWPCKYSSNAFVRAVR